MFVMHLSVIYVQNSEDCKEDHKLLRSSEKLEIEYSPAKSREEISDDECVLTRSTQKGSKQIKHYTSWTSPEVMKLIEGVSQCGVGRWSAMKRLLFSSCSHRTAVDIKVVHGIFYCYFSQHIWDQK